MENFKIKLYEQEYNKPFVSFKQLTVQETESIKKKLFLAFQLEDGLKLVQAINQQGIYLDSFDANDELTFNLKELFRYINKNCPPRIFVNWFRFDQIDEFGFDDFYTYFYDIWFPGADDIDLFDETCSWIVSIRHDGKISIWRPLNKLINT